MLPAAMSMYIWDRNMEARSKLGLTLAPLNGAASYMEPGNFCFCNFSHANLKKHASEVEANQYQITATFMPPL